MQACADLHVHSKYSNRPSEWLLRRIGAPECFSEPEDIYAACLAKGMSFVTLTDHNCIDGALSLAEYPNTFISAELTTYFPSDGCKVHVLVHGITEPQFRTCNELRENIFELQAYCRQEGILHTVAHPLFAVNEKLTAAHFEKLLLLFERFETLNGTRPSQANACINAVFDSLSPALMEELADTHGIEPAGETPWRKICTGGSDDHSGIYVASAHTVTSGADDVAQFLDLLRRGECHPGGSSGTSLRLAHSFYRIAYTYYRDRFLDGSRNSSALLTALLSRMAGNERQVAQTGILRNLVKRVMRPFKRRRLSPIEQTLLDEFGSLIENRPDSDSGRNPARARTADQQTFELASRISHQIGFHFTRNFLDHMRHLSLLESLQTLASLAPVGLSIAPYIAAFATQHKDNRVLNAVIDRFGVRDRLGTGEKKAWITDTFSDVNGVTKTIRVLATLAKQHERDMTVVTCLDEVPDVEGMNIRNFQPVGMFEVPEYSHQKLAFPPFLEVIEYLEREAFQEIIISTPGPLGLTALAAARLLGVKVSGIYHTDFPKYVAILTEDESMAQVTWRYMCWFYGQMDVIFAPSEWYRRHLLANGLSHRPIHVLPRGVDCSFFSPEKRDSSHWTSYGCNGAFKFLYVGRISKEKNLDHLVDAFDILVENGHKADLILVGDGPMMPELRRKYRNRHDIVFTGYLSGEPLATAYASADAFVFPSTTDTFGNVVLEAQACGLPAIVSDEGGPSEIVRRHQSGFVVEMNDPSVLAESMSRLCTDRELNQTLSTRALTNARESSWPNILEMLWHPGGAPEEPGTVEQGTDA